ncbi:hypothetical protein AYO38_02645 [bacterium SCGC AG-212-C10]|nr:hypothetical protein AYO38_02645 [bacterium SCGC AG-212-C10]
MPALLAHRFKSWHHWPEVQVTGNVARCTGKQEPYVLDQQRLAALMSMLLQARPLIRQAAKRRGFSESEIDWRILDLGFWQRLGPAMLELVGPLYPSVSNSLREPSAWYEDERIGFSVPVTLPPEEVSLEELAGELRAMEIALQIVDAIQEAELERLQGLIGEAHSLAALGMDPALEQAMGNWEAEKIGDSMPRFIAHALSWLRRMATRFPVRVTASVEHAGVLEPVVDGPGHTFWFSIAHAVGAISLPYSRLGNDYVGFCAECGKPVFRADTRKTGQRVFCNASKPDPTDSGGGKTRSVCQNRFHSRAGKAKAKAKANANKLTLKVEEKHHVR